MDYINNNTGTSRGPLQIQSQGPWLLYENNALKICQYSGLDEVPLQFKINCHSWSSNKWHPKNVPNMEWVLSCIEANKPGGSGIDFSNYTPIEDFNKLVIEVREIQEVTGEVTKIKTDLTNLKNRVIILEEWKEDLYSLPYIIDGGDPFLQPRYQKVI